MFPDYDQERSCLDCGEMIYSYAAPEPRGLRHSAYLALSPAQRDQLDLLDATPRHRGRPTRAEHAADIARAQQIERPW